jgi:putative restriction endonuclease
MANWQEDELLLTLHLYCRTAFGKLHHRNPDFIQLAQAIGRTASAVAFKATNFASLDESIPQKGMSNTSKADRALWVAFMENSTEVAAPTNGIALNALYDNAFDRHLIPFGAFGSD